MPSPSGFQDKRLSANRKKHQRPRPIISCSECKTRKLRCNRTLPCDQCTKARRGDKCAFMTKSDHAVTKLISTSSTSSPASNNSSATTFATATSSEAGSSWPPRILKVFEHETSYFCAGHWRFILDKVGFCVNNLPYILVEIRPASRFLLTLGEKISLNKSNQS